MLQRSYERVLSLPGFLTAAEEKGKVGVWDEWEKRWTNAAQLSGYQTIRSHLISCLKICPLKKSTYHPALNSWAKSGSAFLLLMPLKKLFDTQTQISSINHNRPSPHAEWSHLLALLSPAGSDTLLLSDYFYPSRRTRRHPFLSLLL